MVTLTKISEGNVKLGLVSNVSMTPIKACGNCESCKDTCYNLKAMRLYPSVKKAWDSNYKLATTKRADYFFGIVDYLQIKRPRLFRWHVGGDILDQGYLDWMCMLAEAFKKTKFLVFTKMHDLDYKYVPKNLTVIFSMFPKMKKPRGNMPIAWMQDGTERRMPSNTMKCNGGCEDCTKCWNIKRDVYFDKH